MEKEDKLIKIMLGIAIGKAVEYVFGLLFSAVALGFIGKLLSDVLSKSQPYSFYIVLIFALGGGLIFNYLFRHFNRNIPHYRPFDFNFSSDEKEIIFEFKENTNGDKATYIKKYTLKPLKNDLKVFEDKYSWTGGVCNTPKSKKSGQDYKLTKRKGTWQPYEVNFDTHLNKNVPIEIEGEWDLCNVSKAVPFISSTVEHPTKRLIFRLKVPKDLKITYVNCEIFIGMGVLISGGESEKKPPDKDGNFEWIIENPKLLHYYEMSWLKPGDNERITNNPT